MADLSTGAPRRDPGFTALGAAGHLDDAELARLYHYPAPAKPQTWVRANFISSIDGAAAVSGRSGALGRTGDRVVFTLLRALADVVVVGAGTVRAENYGGVTLAPPERQRRRAAGQTVVPRLAIVTGSGLLDRDMRVFTDTELPPLVLTCTAAIAATRRRLAGRAEVLDCSANDPARVDEPTMLDVLATRGHYRVLTEGGPSLLGSFIDSGLLDELCLTVAPYLLGGPAPRIATGPGEMLTAMRCAHLLTDDSGYLYGRYVKTPRL